MPELPEVQGLAERLDALLAGAPFTGAAPLAFSALKTYAPPPESLVGWRLDRVGRRGKFLVFEFATGLRMLLHLSQAGRPEIEDPPKTTRPKGAIVRLRFEGRPAVLIREFGTERKAGWWVLGPGDDGPLAKLGPEPLAGRFREFLLTGADGGRVHAFLRAQRRVAGIGRGYSDDILHRAKLSPFRSLSSLKPEERTRL